MFLLASEQFNSTYNTNSYFDAFSEAFFTSLVIILVWVAIVYFVFHLIDHLTHDALSRGLENATAIQPMLGALLGTIPGCGTAALVCTLYWNDKVTFGTLVATLIATFGDMAFIIIAIDVTYFLQLAALTLVIGIVVGYLVDVFQLERRLKLTNEKATQVQKEYGIIDGAHSYWYNKEHLHKPNKNEIPQWFHFVDYYAYPIFFWVSMFILFPFTVTFTFFVNYDLAIFDSDVFLYLALAISLIIFSYSAFRKIIYFFFVNKHKHQIEKPLGSRKNFYDHILVDTSHEISFFHIWISATLWIIATIGYFVPTEDIESWFVSIGGWVILITALIGIIPSCGPQIVIATIWSAGYIPNASMVSNSISQDGDASLITLSTSRKTWTIVSIMNFFVAVIVGYLVYVVEIFAF